eukprot:247372-Prymnesium_polylepis.1
MKPLRRACILRLQVLSGEKGPNADPHYMGEPMPAERTQQCAQPCPSTGDPNMAVGRSEYGGRPSDDPRSARVWLSVRTGAHAGRSTSATAPASGADNPQRFDPSPLPAVCGGHGRCHCLLPLLLPPLPAAATASPQRVDS